MTNKQKWQQRSITKAALLKFTQNEISGEALNLMAGLPADATMPKELFGL